MRTIYDMRAFAALALLAACVTSEPVETLELSAPLPTSRQMAQEVAAAECANLYCDRRMSPGAAGQCAVNELTALCAGGCTGIFTGPFSTEQCTADLRAAAAVCACPSGVDPSNPAEFRLCGAVRPTSCNAGTFNPTSYP